MSSRDPAQARIPGRMENPAAQLREVPFTRAVGGVWTPTRPGRIELGLPFSRAVSDPRHGGVDDRALITMLDHACGAAVFGILSVPLPVATLDLRVVWTHPAPPGRDMRFIARAKQVTPALAQVEAFAKAGQGDIVAAAHGSFIVGVHPGGITGGEELWSPSREFDVGDASRCASFEEFLGLARHGLHVRMPFHDRLVGAMSLPALHGGVVAALLASAARVLAEDGAGAAQTLASINVQYLRAGKAEATTAVAEFVKRGSRSAFVSAVARQAHGSREIARAQCTFIAPE